MKITTTSLDYFTIGVDSGPLSPADSTTYYYGLGRLTPATTETDQDFSLGFPFTVIGIVMSCAANTTPGSTENSSLFLRNVTQATNTAIGSFQTNASVTVTVVTVFSGLNINVAANDSITIGITTPNWATNPVAVRHDTFLICKKR